MQIFSGARWGKLASQDAYPQRPLWASAGTKNSLYPDTLYVDELIGANTVNTIPPATLHAFLAHGSPAETITPVSIKDAANLLAHLKEHEIELEIYAQKLMNEGVVAFEKSFKTLLISLSQKHQDILANKSQLQLRLGNFQPTVSAALEAIRANATLERIWMHDYTIWKPSPTEIANRLGWLHAPETMVEQIGQLNDLLKSLQGEGIEQAMLLGMGGSSLAPEVFSKIFTNSKKGLSKGLSVLDSTDPQAVLAAEKSLNLAKTVFIVSTKSGGTVETFSFFKHFYNRVVEKIGADRAGSRFIAITDPGSGLADIAAKYNFRASDDVVIPDEAGKLNWKLTFGALKAARALGDAQALRNAGRAVIHFDLGADALTELKKL